MPPRKQVITSNDPCMQKTLNLRLWSAERREWILQAFPVARLNMYCDFHNVYKSTDSTGYNQESMNISMLVIDISLHDLITSFNFLSLKNLSRLCIVHSLTYRANNKQQLKELLLNHTCSAFCGECHIVTFKYLSTPRQMPTFSVTLSSSAAPLPQSATGTPDIVPHAPPTSSYDHLQILSDTQKSQLLADWHQETSTSALQVMVCAACGRKVFKSLSKTVDSQSKLHDILPLLRNPSLPSFLRPIKYDFEAYHQAVLHVKGLATPHAIGPLTLCIQCDRSLAKGQMPRFALANDLYTAHELLPPDVSYAFENSTLGERMMVCRARYNRICCKFDPNESKKDKKRRAPENKISPESILANARKGVRGNIIVVPLDTVKMRRLIPPPISAIKDTMCAVFVGSTKPTAEDFLKTTKTPMLVRRSRVKTIIDFLLEHNPQYRPRPDYFGFSAQNLEDMFGPGDEGIPSSVEIGVMDENETIRVTTADYTPRNDDFSIPSGESPLLMENVGYTDGDTSTLNYLSMKAYALERCRNGKPFIAAGAGNTPVPDFQNPNILAWLFPHLDPWGIAGFNHQRRRVKLSLEEQLRYFLQLEDPRYQEDPEFSFVFFNVVRKMHVAQSVRFAVKPTVHEKLATDLMSIDTDTLQLLGKKFELNPMYIPSNPVEGKAYDVMSSLSMIARHIPGSNGYKVNLRNQIRAMINFHGTPTLFITLNPADVDNPIVRLLTGENISLEDLTRGEDMPNWNRKLFAAKHPGACAQFFHIMMTTFIKVALRANSSPPQPGVFGICDAYYGTVEAQGKGTLHCHMLLWIRGHLPPQQLRDTMAASVEYRDRVFKWVESIISCELPVSTPNSTVSDQPLIRVRYKDIGNPHPGTIPAPLTILRNPAGKHDWSEFNHFLTQLLIEYNWHVHNEICWKYLRKHEPRNDQTCRLRMNGITREHTSLDPDSGALLLRRLHPQIAAYNPLITVMLKSNTEVKFIGSGQAARDLVFYITDYVTKPTLPLHVGVTALQYAIGKVNKHMADSAECYSPGMNISTVTTAVNSMMGRHEISQPQVMSYLVGGGDHYTSEQFNTINWGHILKYVDSVLDQSLTHHNHTQNASTDVTQTEAAINVDIRRDSVTLSSQTLDYMYRSTRPQFDNLCLYDFAAYVTKAAIPKDQLRNGDLDNIAGCFSSWEHPQRASHHLKHRQKMHVPVLLGPSIPNPARSPDHLEKWAKCISILFKPWRQCTDIKNNQQTWNQCFEDYKANLSEKHMAIIKNMNAFAESKDARGDAPPRFRGTEISDHSVETDNPFPFHTETEIETELNGGYDDQDTQANGDDTGSTAEDDAGITDVYLCTDRSSQNSQMIDSIAIQRLGPDATVGFDMCLSAASIHTDEYHLCESEAREPTGNDFADLVEYEAFMKAQRAQRTARGRATSSNPEQPQQNAPAVVQPYVEIMEIETDKLDRNSFPKRQDNLPLPDIVSSVIEQMNLASNPEQLEAFTTVAEHLTKGNSNQLLMYVSGVGGTGKSHVIKSIVTLFERLGVRDQMLIGAPTGIAAVLIGGQTLHSLTLLGTAGKKGKIEDLMSIWKTVRYLIVDEVSMIGAAFLSLLSNRMREAKYHNPETCSTPFGGVNVIFMGDFGQLSPAGQCSLYAHSIIHNPAFRTLASVNGISAMNGVLLWRQVTKVVELVQNHRHSGDPVYATFVARIRLGICTPHPSSFSVSGFKSDWTYILERLMVNLDEATIPPFRDAPIIVGNKVTRDVLNAKCILYHSTKMSKKVNIYHSIDTIKRIPVKAGLREKLWNIPSSNNKDSFGRLPLFSGMKVMVTENIAFGHNVVNGAEGTIQRIVHTTRQNGIRSIIMVFVHIPGSGVKLRGLAQDVVPISPVSTRIECIIKLDNNITQKGFTRRQVPLVPAYAYTDYKSQGRTIPYIIVDLYTAKAQGVYVMLSRTTSISGLAVLRWFPSNKIYSRMSGELRTELDRLHSLAIAPH